MRTMGNNRFPMNPAIGENPRILSNVSGESSWVGTVPGPRTGTFHGMTARVFEKKADLAAAQESPITGLRKDNIRIALRNVQGNSGLFPGNTATVRKAGSVTPQAPLTAGRKGNNGIGSIVPRGATGLIDREETSARRAGSNGPARGIPGLVVFVRAKI